MTSWLSFRNALRYVSRPWSFIGCYTFGKVFGSCPFYSGDLFIKFSDLTKLVGGENLQDVTFNHLRWMGNLVIVTHVFVIWLDIWHLYACPNTLPNVWQVDIVSRSLICDFWLGCWNSSRVEICAQLSASITHQTVNFILDLWSGEGVSEHPMFSVLWQSVLTLCAGKAANICKYKQISSWSSEFVAIWICFLAYACKDSQTSTYCNTS